MEIPFTGVKNSSFPTLKVSRSFKPFRKLHRYSSTDSNILDPKSADAFLLWQENAKQYDDKYPKYRLSCGEAQGAQGI